MGMRLRHDFMDLLYIPDWYQSWTGQPYHTDIDPTADPTLQRRPPLYDHEPEVDAMSWDADPHSDGAEQPPAYQGAWMATTMMTTGMMRLEEERARKGPTTATTVIIATIAMYLHLLLPSSPPTPLIGRKTCLPALLG